MIPFETVKSIRHSKILTPKVTNLSLKSHGNVSRALYYMGKFKLYHMVNDRLYYHKIRKEWVPMKNKRQKHHPIRNTILGLLIVFFCMISAACAFFGVKGYKMYRETITEKTIEERVEEVRSIENFTPYSELPEFYIEAVISVEDHRFEEHHGIDLIAIGRAILTDIKAMSFVEGGSTITQQLVKNLLFTQEKKMERKAAEIIGAFEMESNYTKEEIFELYANTAYFGSVYYGIYEAAMGYFGKEPLELTDYESAMLAGIPNAPSVYSPDANKELASQRVAQVLNSMVRHKIIAQDEAERIGKTENSD